MLLKPSVSALNKIRKRYSISKNGAITGAMYREAVALTQSSSTKKHDPKFSFVYSFLHFSAKSIAIEVKGDHLSKNRVDSLPMRHKLRYKKAFKDGARALCLLERKRLRSLPMIQKAKVHFVFYTTHGRDYDNHSETIKRIQDTAVSILGILPDDNPDIITPLKPKYYKAKNKKDRRVLMVIRRMQKG